MNKSAREKEAVLSVFAALVRPLMRVAFEYGISASEIAGVVRRTYIQALEARLLEQKRPTTDARLAVVAGLTKSDVSALREAAHAGAPHSLTRTVKINQITNLLTVWHTHTGFSGAYGLAMDLDLGPTVGSPRRSFSELVAAACPGADEEELLDELVAAGSVEVIDSSTVRCLSRAYVQKEADVKRIERMGRFLAAVTGNFVHNLLRVTEEPVYFERAVISDELLSEGGRDKFLALSGERGQALLTELDTFLTRLATSDGNASGKRYGLGIYFFESAPTGPVEEAQTPEDDGKPNRERATKVEEIDVLAGLGRHK
jgi:Family of unknown function (DUF6502)